MVTPPPATDGSPRPMDVLATMPFAQAVGIRLVTLASGAVVGELDWRPERTTLGGAMHGGAIMALADTVGAVAAFLDLPPGATGTSTIESKSNLVGAVREGTVVATATVVHAGRRTMVVQTESRVAGRLVALTTQTQAVIST